MTEFHSPIWMRWYLTGLIIFTSFLRSMLALKMSLARLYVHLDFSNFVLKILLSFSDWNIELLYTHTLSLTHTNILSLSLVSLFHTHSHTLAHTRTHIHFPTPTHLPSWWIRRGKAAGELSSSHQGIKSQWKPLKHTHWHTQKHTHRYTRTHTHTHTHILTPTLIRVKSEGYIILCKFVKSIKNKVFFLFILFK